MCLGGWQLGGAGRVQNVGMVPATACLGGHTDSWRSIADSGIDQRTAAAKIDGDVQMNKVFQSSAEAGAIKRPRCWSAPVLVLAGSERRWLER